MSRVCVAGAGGRGGKGWTEADGRAQGEARSQQYEARCIETGTPGRAAAALGRAYEVSDENRSRNRTHTAVMSSR